ncbi:MAG: hydratase [Desulfovibrionaceae bacterium]|nr:hydratase [Desulfovibrionaceae bacterium]
MITIRNQKSIYLDGRLVPAGEAQAPAGKGMAESILQAHNVSGDPKKYAICFDAMLSHDITYVSIVQTARASGLKRFPIPYSFTNCHNSLCAIGGTINADDHRFGLSAARKYGGDYVPPNLAVIHQYAREMVAAPGRMVMASDSHTRYGALGCMGVGEGGGELVKQVLGKTWNVDAPKIVAIYLTGSPRPGVGPQDVAIALVTALFPDAVVKNSVMEFMGPGIAGLPMDYRMGIDVMTTETACLTSIWETDEVVHEYLTVHGRGETYRAIHPENGAAYDTVVEVDLSAIEPMIALPFHPSLGVPIREFNENVEGYVEQIEARARKLMGEKFAQVPDLKSKIHNGRFRIDQAVVSGCCGGLYGNLAVVAEMLRGRTIGATGINYSVYPASQPVLQELMKSGAISDIINAGVTLRTAFCGPCFGAGDVPGQNCFSIRHVTRNFANREGSKAAGGQISYVALMDARSITATMLNGGFLTPAGDDTPATPGSYGFDPTIYTNNVYHGYGHEEPEAPLSVGPNIADWPNMIGMPDNLLLKVGIALRDKVTTTDDFIASGEPSAFRSNPGRMAEYTLRSKDPDYVARAKSIRDVELERQQALAEGRPQPESVRACFAEAGLDADAMASSTALGSLVFAIYPGDGSAREQAASCQKVLGGWANIAGAYATKRYRSNCINWGLLPLVTDDDAAGWEIATGDTVYIPGIRALLEGEGESLDITIFRGGQAVTKKVSLPGISREERSILLAGCLINFYR